MKYKLYSLLVSLVLTLSVRAGQPAFTVTSSVPSGIATLGQPVTFTVQRNDPASTNSITIKILRERHEVVCSEEMPSTEQTHTIHFTPKTSNWFLCNVTSLSNDNEAKPVLVAATGIIIEPEKITPSVPEPVDFDAFWNEKKALLASHPATPKIWPVSAEQKKVDYQTPVFNAQQIAAAEKAGFQAVNIEIDTPGVRPVEGVYVRPKDASPKSRPAIISFHGAGVSNVCCRSMPRSVLETAKKYNAIVMDINAHGMLNDQPQDYYDALDKGELFDYAHQGAGDREKYYFLGMYLRLMRVIDFICSQPEWDGKHLICIGSSQAGGQAMIAAGLDKRVSAVAVAVPALCDLAAPLDGRAGCWPNPTPYGNSNSEQYKAILNTVGYFDAVNHVKRSHATFLIGAGLADPTCPGSSIYAAYNRVVGEKQILLAPNGTHFTVDPFIDKQRSDFILSRTKN